MSPDNGGPDRPALRILRMRRDDPIACGLMPGTIQRLTAFCQRFDLDTDPGDLAEFCWRLFGAGDPRLGLWVAASADWTLRGHTLAMPEPFETRWKYTLIRQAEVDEKVNARAETHAVMQAVIAWTRDELHLDRIRLVTHRNMAAMARRWGATPYRHIMEIAIDKGKNAPAPESPVVGQGSSHKEES